MDTLNLDLITPEATYFSGNATLVEAPGTLGDFGVLPGHMRFISTLRPGVVTIHNQNNETTHLFVSGGVAEVNPVSCTILAEHVTDLKKISHIEAEDRLKRARMAVDLSTGDEAEKYATRKEQELAEALVAAIEA
jgi:F-type H+-transporting ATPase subunit epsilon